MGYLVNIQGGPVISPGGEPLPNTTLELRLVNPLHHRPTQLVDVPSDYIPLGRLTVTTDANALVDFDIWPNSRGDRPSVYALRLPAGAAESVFVSLEESNETVSWATLLASREPRGYNSLLRQHLDDDQAHLTAADQVLLDAVEAFLESGSAGVTSFAGRQGVVVPDAADYAAFFLTEPQIEAAINTRIAAMQSAGALPPDPSTLVDGTLLQVSAGKWVVLQ